MADRNINNAISKLKEKDIYSFLLFVLYKLRDNPKYTTLSELSFILDKDSLLKLCEYFGGLEVKMPTIKELELLINALILYENLYVNKLTYEEAIEKLNLNTKDLKQLKLDFNDFCDILADYSWEDFKNANNS